MSPLVTIAPAFHVAMDIFVPTPKQALFAKDSVWPIGVLIRGKTFLNNFIFIL